MCQINCSGGCPECAPDEHQSSCLDQWGANHICICEELEFLHDDEWTSDSSENFIDYYSGGQ